MYGNSKIHMNICDLNQAVVLMASWPFIVCYTSGPIVQWNNHNLYTVNFLSKELKEMALLFLHLLISIDSSKKPCIFDVP